MERIICIDFETEAIQERPHHPPVPVGVAIGGLGELPTYLAWGHPTGNNCTRGQAEAALLRVITPGVSVLCHNSKFDLDVLETHFSIPMPDWQNTHDTLFQLFLTDPHALSLGLKESAERLLGEKPTERDAVRDWLVEHKVITSAQRPGAFISKAPGDVVAPYACGDVSRTLRLHALLYPRIQAAGMQAAYDRERRLMPCLLDNERRGIRVDVDTLARDIEEARKRLILCDALLRHMLSTPTLNVDADQDLARALRSSGVVTRFAQTETGKDSISKKTLTQDRFRDPEVFKLLNYRNMLQTLLSQSMEPWLDQACRNRGRISTEWNQVRQSHGDDNRGTRTGRLSASRVQNINKRMPKPEDLPTGFPPLPRVRRYLLPDEGHRWLHRDYRQQEWFVTAHMASGQLAQMYTANPEMDQHDMVVARVAQLGITITREQAKVVGFGLLYGMGSSKLGDTLGVSQVKARSFTDALRAAMPDVNALDREAKRRFQNGQTIRTWGGRVYSCEPAKENRTFEYKALNVLVQGSSADITKEAVCRYWESGSRRGRLLSTVHDEINVSGPPEELEVLREAMEGVPLDVPLQSSPKTGPNWGELK
jgi:DNA polymerase-1